MSDRILAAGVTALIGAAAGAALLLLAYLVAPAIAIEFAVDPPRLVSGIHPPEHDQASGLTFAWTGRDAAIRLPGLDRRAAWTAEIRLRGARQNRAENPTVTVLVDGIRRLTHESTTDFGTVTVELPPRPERPRGALLAIQSSATFVPGPQDPRQLGVMLDWIRITPKGTALPPRDVVTGAAVAAAALGAAIALIGLRVWMAVAFTLFLAACQSLAFTYGLAPFTAFPEQASRLAAAVGVGTVALVLLMETLRKEALTATAGIAVSFTALALFLKLLILLHPHMPIGDALFQAHRFQEVLRGNYYFTSIAPGNYLFPYAPGLYVAASPFADLVRREAGDVVLLRIVVAATDALVGALLYTAVVRSWRDGRAAAAACVIYQVLPLDFRVASGGTLTNAFAQSLAVGVLVIASLNSVRLDRPLAAAALALAMLAAFLSHTSTFAILSATGVVICLTLLWRGGDALRSGALAVGAATLAAIVLSIALYYAHFMETYRTELTRISAETASGAADAGGRTIGVRAGIVPLYLYSYFGVPSIVLAAIGAAHLWRRGARDRLTLTVAAWAIACTVFLVIGVLTPVDMRYYVAALPALAIAAAAGAAHWWTLDGPRRAAAWALVAAASAIGLWTWWSTLR